MQIVSTEKPIGTKEVANMLGVTSRTVTRLAEKGEIPAFRVGEVWKFHRSDIQEFIDSQKRRKPENHGESS